MNMRKVSEQTVITALVNYKCVGYFGKCIKHFSLNERRSVVNKIIENEWLKEDLTFTDKGNNVVKANLSLCQY